MFLKAFSTFLLVRFALSVFVYEQSFPDSVNRCFRDAKTKPVDMDRAKTACIMAYYSQVSEPRKLTKEDRTFFQRRIDERFGLVPPKSGFRLRREIRTLSTVERHRLMTVLKIMYESGTLHRFGRLHGQTGKGVHKGAAFLPWHRLFILDFEEEMRRIDGRVFLPYWDYTIDNNITRPSDSVVWSECFFGNGAGYIESGPFKNWYGGHSIQMLRDYARGGQCPPRLINKMDIKGILQKCHFKDVTTGAGPFFDNPTNIEMLHDGVHDWVGGDMDELPYSAFDPVFYMHHAFIDFIWEKFRRHQKKTCNVNPETDWRPRYDLCQKGRKDHGAFDTMFGYTHLRNIDGSWNNWTHVFYNYEDQPSCPACGSSRYLYCDKSIDPRFPEGLCLTKTIVACQVERTAPSEMMEDTAPTSELIEGIAPTSELVEDTAPNSEMKVNLQNGMPRFHAFTNVERYRGISGDGRNRNMSLEESYTILKAEIAKGIPINRTEIDSNAKTNILRYIPMKSSPKNQSTHLGDKSRERKDHTISLQACSKGCLGFTVVGLSLVALLMLAIVAFVFVNR